MMLKIEEWGNNKPLMLTMLAQLMASFTGYIELTGDSHQLNQNRISNIINRTTDERR